LIVIAYRKFSDTLQNEFRAPTPPKPAKAPKVDPIERAARTLGGLGALGGPPVEMQNPAPPYPAPWGEVEAERVAIVEHDGKIPREWAEGFARLDPDRPPRDVPPHRWRSICDAISAFLDCWGAEAARLGWTAHDLFGADGERPEVTWLNSGPLWSGDGARVVELDADRIVFETRGGARQTAPRRPPLRPRVLPWEI
jgi:hypothetical protein